jgi:hypothetical protein
MRWMKKAPISAPPPIAPSKFPCARRLLWVQKSSR